MNLASPSNKNYIIWLLAITFIIIGLWPKIKIAKINIIPKNYSSCSFEDTDIKITFEKPFLEITPQENCWSNWIKVDVPENKMFRFRIYQKENGGFYEIFFIDGTKYFVKNDNPWFGHKPIYHFRLRGKNKIYISIKPL
jgi:hypothetical protein